MHMFFNLLDNLVLRQQQQTGLESPRLFTITQHSLGIKTLFGWLPIYSAHIFVFSILSFLFFRSSPTHEKIYTILVRFCVYILLKSFSTQQQLIIPSIYLSWIRFISGLTPWRIVFIFSVLFVSIYIILNSRLIFWPNFDEIL